MAPSTCARTRIFTGLGSGKRLGLVAQGEGGTSRRSSRRGDLSKKEQLLLPSHNSPSPWPSPAGRGNSERTVADWRKIWPRVPSPVLGGDGEGFSLSQRERVGVRISRTELSRFEPLNRSGVSAERRHLAGRKFAALCRDAATPGFMGRESGSFHQPPLKKWDAPLAAKAETIILDGNTPKRFQ